MKAIELRERFNSMMFSNEAENLTTNILGLLGDIIIYLEQQEKQKETKMTAKLRAKIQIGNVMDNKNTSGEKYAESINAHAVYSSDPESENAKWAQATPSFNLNMFINNPKAFGQLEQGKQYYVDFIPAE